jgi:hypothetical protein
MRNTFFTAIIVITVFSSCHYFSKGIRGNGVMKTETRNAAGFSSINVSGSTNVYVKQDSVFSVRVEAEENLQEYIITETDGGTLKIHQKEGTSLNPTKSIKVYVSGPMFKHFEASGACDIYTENQLSSNEAVSINLSGSSDVKLELKAPDVKVDLSGAGTITLKGETKDLKVDGSGSTDINCFELLTENTAVSLSGAGNAEVFASIKLDVHVSGAADVKYKGNAAVNQEVSGAGSVKKVEAPNP